MINKQYRNSFLNAECELQLGHAHGFGFIRLRQGQTIEFQLPCKAGEDSPRAVVVRRNWRNRATHAARLKLLALARPAVVA
jgi:hypothetical protein